MPVLGIGTGPTLVSTPSNETETNISTPSSVENYFSIPIDSFLQQSGFTSTDPVTNVESDIRGQAHELFQKDSVLFKIRVDR